MACRRPGPERAGADGGAVYELLADRTTLLLQLQGFAACGDSEVRDLVPARLAGMWDTVADTAGLDPVTVKSFLAFGMLLNNVAALDVDKLDEPWAKGVHSYPSGTVRAHHHGHQPMKSVNPVPFPVPCAT